MTKHKPINEYRIEIDGKNQIEHKPNNQATKKKEKNKKWPKNETDRKLRIKKH